MAKAILDEGKNENTIRKSSAYDILLYVVLCVPAYLCFFQV